MSLTNPQLSLIVVPELSFTHKAIFFNVATELIDNDHPPPATMPIETENNIFWKVKPCRASVPFHISLPVKVGPGPFVSARARIRYVIHGLRSISPTLGDMVTDYVNT